MSLYSLSRCAQKLWSSTKTWGHLQATLRASQKWSHHLLSYSSPNMEAKPRNQEWGAAEPRHGHTPWGCLTWPDPTAATLGDPRDPARASSSQKWGRKGKEEKEPKLGEAVGEGEGYADSSTAGSFCVWLSGTGSKKVCVGGN